MKGSLATGAFGFESHDERQSMAQDNRVKLRLGTSVPTVEAAESWMAEIGSRTA